VSNLSKKQFKKEPEKEPEDVYKVPARFFQDHVDRHNDHHEMISRIEKSSGNYHHVRLTDSQLSDLHSDASYYANEGPEYADKGVISSAKATLRALGRYFE
jgi:hypothetical protein